MIPFNTIPTQIQYLRERKKEHPGFFTDTSEADHPKEQESGPEQNIYCLQCHQVITSNHHRIIRDGANEHTFANPGGLIFNIACFRSVTGCAYAGPLSQEFTWFKGYHWRIVVCNMCLTHLGWYFVSSGSDNFHVLILDRLLIPKI